MLKFFALIFLFVGNLFAAHPAMKFVGHWQGPCTVNSSPSVLMQLKIFLTQTPNKLSYTIIYDKEVRSYHLILDEKKPTRIILDEGNGALFEEMLQNNVMFGLLRAGDIRMHSRFELKNKTIQVQMTTFSVQANNTFKSFDILQEDYHPRSIQDCVLNRI